MKKLIQPLIFAIIFTPAFAQKDTISIDLLRSPSTPGFLLLGIEEASVERPTNPTDFMVKVRNATNNFSSLPKSFAIDFAPGWIWGANKITYDKFFGNAKRSLYDNIAQTAIISFATNTLNDKTDSSLTQISIGFKVSLVRGKILQEEYQKIANVRELQRKIAKGLNITISDAKKANKKIKDLEFKIREMLANNISPDSLGQELDILNKVVADSVTKKFLSDSSETKNLANYIKKAQKIKYDRFGFKLDLAGGLVYDYPAQKVANRSLSRWGLWLTAAQECKTVSFLGVARLLVNPNEVYKNKENKMVKNDNLHFDLGARIIVKPIEELNISAEIINRKVLNNADLNATIRWAINIDYSVGKNQLLNFSYGKNFDESRFKNQKTDLIAALTYIIGFGSQRSKAL